MKRITLLAFSAMVLVTALLLGGPSISQALAHASTFSDIAETDQTHAAVQALAARQIMGGDSESIFSPYTPVSRAEATETLVKWRDAEPLTTESVFPDVSPADQLYVAAAFANGWISGYPDGTFRPEQTLTRQQMVTVVIRALGMEAQAQSLTSEQVDTILGPFLDDGAVSAGARSYLALAVTNRLVGGDSGRLMPVSPVTRSQLALMLYRAEDSTHQSAADSVDDPHASDDKSTVPEIGLTPEEQAKADFMTTYLFRPHNSPITGEMVLQNEEWYGVPAISQLVIMAAETSLGDPRLGGSLARNNNFGCLRYHGASTPWGLLSSGRIWAAGKDWYAFPDAATGMTAFGRYLKVGVNGFYLPILTQADPNWEKFAAVYYGRGVSGFSSYVSRLNRIENSFRSLARDHGVAL